MSEHNPHYVTPEEAGKMDCAMRPDDRWCNGPKCMAWRWGEEEYGERVGNSSFSMNVVRTRKSTTHGYCGMVRS